MTEEPTVSASSAGRDLPAADARPAISDVLADLGGEEKGRVVAYLRQAPPELQLWADGQLRDIDPDGTIAGSLAEPTEEESGSAPSPSPRESAAKGGGLAKPLLIAAALIAVILGVYYMGLPTNAPGAGPTAMPTMGSGQMGSGTPLFQIDAEREADLIAQVEADPTDLDAMRELAAVYFEGGDWPKATTWLIRVVEGDPSDVDSRLMLGVTHFNVGSVAQAEVQWKKVTEIAPDLPEAYYNLGFIYLSETPPDLEAATEVWNKVLELDPESPLAATVRAHLDGMTSGG